MIKEFIGEDVCSSCGGSRLSQEALSVKINDKTIDDASNMQLTDLLEFIENIKHESAEIIINKLIEMLSTLVQIGVGYLNLSRPVNTLSGGEAQRIKLAKQLGCSLTEMLYILDEPSVGLHPRDVHNLGDILLKIRDKNNTVLVVEHDTDIIKIADNIIEMGYRAGSKGGTVVYQGSYEGLKKSDALTGKFLNKSIGTKQSYRSYTEYFEIKNANANNLKNVSVNIPKNVFNCITGVAGSGKSSLIHKEFLKKHNNAIVVDQSQIGRSNRSNPATYCGAYDLIRKEFANSNNVSASLFSFNSSGACSVCNGQGFIEIEMAFMGSVKQTCDECNGHRYKKEVLEYKYKGYTITDVLNMTINESLELWNKKAIKDKLEMLVAVGLGYLKLGQPLSTLSGGECQRVKLASELHKEGNIYVLDEPTTGLHMSDIERLLDIFNKIVDKGNTLIVIEHNLDVIKNADYIIDIGKEGGTLGGEIVFTGTPKELIACTESYTGEYLKKHIEM